MHALRAMACLVLVPCLCATAAADGIPAYYDEQGWHLLSEESQYAVVSMRDGQESLLLRIAVSDRATPDQASQLVWVIPVPAAPSRVQVDILKGFPRFSGFQPTGKLGADLRSLLTLMAATQIYPVPLFFTAFFGLDRSAEGEQAVHVFKKIRRDGVELELLGAETIESLTSHLQSLEVKFPRTGLEKLKSYTGPDHCLVVFRVADFVAYRKAVGQEDDSDYSLGVEIDFPARYGFFPLVASSALPGETLSVQLTVAGYAQTIGQHPKDLETEYYLGKMQGGAEVHKALGVAASQPIRYTRFRVDGPPGNLTADLRFQPGAPAGVLVATHFLTVGSIVRLLLGLLIFILVSVLSVLLVVPAWPRDARPKCKAFVLLAFANLATVIGLIFAARSLARRVGSSPRRATLFSVMVSLVFVFLLAGLSVCSYLF